MVRRTSIERPRLGIDEHSFFKRFQFVTVVVAFFHRQDVLHIAADRTAQTVGGYLAGLSVEEQAGMTPIAMDMRHPYPTAVRAYVPGADTKIDFEGFQVMRQVLEGVDQARRREYHELQRQGGGDGRPSAAKS